MRPGLGQRLIEREQIGFVALDSIQLRLAGRSADRPDRRACNGIASPAGGRWPSGSRGLRAALGRRPSPGRAREAEGDFARFVGEPLERRDQPSASSVAACGERVERPRHPRQNVLRRAVGFVEQRSNPPRRSSESDRRSSASGPREPARRIRPISVARPPARRARIPEAPARDPRASADSISSCRFRRKVSCAAAPGGRRHFFAEPAVCVEKLALL